jgi:3-methylcrotonyl-CoA carboxylase beta subunit
VKAAIGETVTPEELGGGDLHCRTSGVTDYYALNDEHALGIARRLIQNLNDAKPHITAIEPMKEPLYSPEDLYGMIPENLRKPFEVRHVIARIVDGSEFDEFKELYGSTLVTGHKTIYEKPIK